MTIGKRIKTLRKENNDTLEVLGRKLNFNYSNLSKIERGTRRPSIDLLKAISELYNVPVSQLIGEDIDSLERSSSFLEETTHLENNDLIKRNERLLKENKQLKSELDNLKMCFDLLLKNTKRGE